MTAQRGGGRLLVANLDAEWHLARSAGRVVPTPGAPLRRRLAAAATLLRALLEDGDVLELPGPVDAGRLGPGLPRVHLRVRAGGPPPPGSIPWMVAPGWEGAASRSTVDGGAPWWRRWLAGPGPSPAMVARWAHRGTQLDLAASLGLEWPGATLVSTVEALEEHLAGRPRGEPWVLKPVFGAAGHGHLHGAGALTGTDGLEERVERAFQMWGELLLEPWAERRDDFGVSARVAALPGEDHPAGEREAQDTGTGTGARAEAGPGPGEGAGGVEGAGVGVTEVLGVHRLLVDGRGRFRGVAVDDVPPEVEGALEETARRVGARLAMSGFTGPFGVDAFRDVRGRLRAFVELNPRLTFGVVARAIVERCEGGRSAGRTVLRLARGGREPVPPSALVLLRPGDRDDTAAWLEAR